MKRAASAGAAAVTAPTILGAQADAGQGAATPPPAAETPAVEVLTGGRSGSDFMVDVIKSLGVPYVCGNPGSSFRGLQESIVNYGGNAQPEFLTCLHEEIVGGDGARLRQDRRQAAHRARARHRRPAARVDGDLQRLVRSRAGLRHPRQHARCDHAVPGRRMGAQRAGRRGDGARLRQVGRHAGLAAAFRRVGGARVQGLDDAAGPARSCSWRTPSCRSGRFAEHGASCASRS